MSFAEVRDYALWTDQLYGNDVLQAKISDMADGDLIELEVDGFRGTWRKVSGKLADQPRVGVAPSGEAMRHWLALRDEKYAGIAAIKDCSPS